MLACEFVHLSSPLFLKSYAHLGFLTLPFGFASLDHSAFVLNSQCMGFSTSSHNFARSDLPLLPAGTSRMDSSLLAVGCLQSGSLLPLQGVSCLDSVAPAPEVSHLDLLMFLRQSARSDLFLLPSASSCLGFLPLALGCVELGSSLSLHGPSCPDFSLLLPDLASMSSPTPLRSLGRSGFFSSLCGACILDLSMLVLGLTSFDFLSLTRGSARLEPILLVSGLAQSDLSLLVRGVS